MPQGLDLLWGKVGLPDLFFNSIQALNIVDGLVGATAFGLERRHRAALYASDPAFLDAVMADERGWRPLPLEPMTMLVFRHESLMEFSRESFTFIAQGKRGKAP